MLQKEPESRPSATDLDNKYLPSLIEPEENDLTVNQEEELAIDNTERK